MVGVAVHVTKYTKQVHETYNRLLMEANRQRILHTIPRLCYDLIQRQKVIREARAGGTQLCSPGRLLMTLQEASDQ